MKTVNLDNLPVGVDAHLVARILALCKNVSENQGNKFTEFLDPYHLEFIGPLVANIFGIRWLAAGGYGEAERQRLAIFPDYYSPADIEMPIAVFRIKLSDPTRILSHRDYLGALMAQGIKRSFIGDILPFTGGAHFVAAREIAGAVLGGLTEIHKFKAEVAEIPPYSISGQEQPVKTVSCTVASVRLDAVLSAGLGIGRNKGAELIKGERVKVNWRQISQPSFSLKAGDVISIRGRGRLELSAVGGETKKGRIRIQVDKFN